MSEAYGAVWLTVEKDASGELLMGFDEVALPQAPIVDPRKTLEIPADVLNELLWQSRKK